MFKRTLNRAVLRLRLETHSPLLVKAGDAGLDPAATDMACVRTHHATFGRSVYIPGSSLKGVLRSSAEASVRGRTFEGRQGACDPLHAKDSCSRQVSRDLPTPQIHRSHCLACRLFGSTLLKGRCAVRDLYPWPLRTLDLDGETAENFRRANATEVRHGVAIDRIRGSVSHGPFDLEVVPAGVRFWGDIALENYQLWQLGLLAGAIEEVNEGFAQLGSGKSKGLGVVRIVIEELVHEQIGGSASAPQGVGSLIDPKERESYGLLAEPGTSPLEGRRHGLSYRFEMKEKQASSWLAEGLSALEGRR